MDLDKALAAHADWKVKLRVALTEHQVLDAERIASDCQCDLGRWLQHEGKAAHSMNPSFRECVEAHTEFHRAAGAVARLINRKDFAGAERQLDVGSDFSGASTRVAVAVRRLKREAEAAA